MRAYPTTIFLHRDGRVRAVHGLDVVGRDLGHLITDAKLPQIGQEKAKSYEGEGYAIVKAPSTAQVVEALRGLVVNPGQSRPVPLSAVTCSPRITGT